MSKDHEQEAPALSEQESMEILRERALHGKNMSFAQAFAEVPDVEPSPEDQL